MKTAAPRPETAEWQRLFEEEQVDLVIGYISSSDCLAVAPLAEQHERLTIAFDCGTSRLFEEQSYRYVFRTNAHQAIDSLAGARYLLDVYPDVSTIAGINQNYSWGQDSWAHFRDTMQVLKPGIQVVEEQFPKVNAADYKAEIASLVTSRPQVIHSSFWGGDLQLTGGARLTRRAIRSQHPAFERRGIRLTGLARENPCWHHYRGARAAWAHGARQPA